MSKTLVLSLSGFGVIKAIWGADDDGVIDDNAGVIPSGREPVCH